MARVGDPASWKYEDAVPWHDWSVRYRLPVVHTPNPMWRYHVAVVVPDERNLWGVLTPDEGEVAVLGSYLQYRIQSFYNARWIAKMAQEPLDTDATVNTFTFMKHRDRGWQYKVASWELHGPWPYSAMEQPAFPGLAGLIGLLDWECREIGGAPGEVSPAWAAWKGKHPEVFTVGGVWVLPEGMGQWPPPRPP